MSPMVDIGNQKNQKNKKIVVLDKETLMMSSLIPFYSHSYNLEQLMNIVEGKSKLSLRIVDWFIINYAKEYDTCFNIKKEDKIDTVFVFVDYKSGLKSYTKKYFDVFKRFQKIDLEYYDKKEKTNKIFNTSIGQLTIFRWIIKRKILDYINMYYEQIYDDMNKRSNTKDRKKKTRLSVSLCGAMNQHNIEMLATFNDE